MMNNRLAFPVTLCLSMALVALPVGSGAEENPEPTSVMCWDAPESQAVSTCTSAWEESPASNSCSNVEIIVYPGTTGQGTEYCTCSVDATCTKDDGVTTMTSGVATNDPDDYKSVVNCDGQISFDPCTETEE